MKKTAPIIQLHRPGVAGTTRLVDAIIPELFDTYTTNDTVELTAFADSGIVTGGDIINQMVQHGGGSITLPHWNDLDSSEEPNYSNDDPADRATPDKIGSGEQSARVAFLNNGWSAADLVKELAGSDPNQRIASRVDAYWARQWQSRVMRTTVGLYLSNVANDDGDMVYDATVGGTVAAPFSVDAFIEGAYTMGDHVGSLNVMGIHSVIAKRMAKNDQIETIRDSEGNILYMAYKNARLVVDDGMPTFMPAGGGQRQYLSVLFGAGSLISGYGDPRVPHEVDRDPRGGHGGGIEELWSRKTWLIHPRGYKFTGQQLTGNGQTDDGTPWKNASWADLAFPGNWDRVYDRKKVNMAFIVTNG